MSDEPVPHVLFRYHPDYACGEYDAAPLDQLVPLARVREVGPEVAFSEVALLPEEAITGYSLDEIYDAQGNRLPGDAHEAPAPGMR